MNLHPSIINAFEEIDAALFSGDSFYSPENRKELERYILRWNRELKNLNESRFLAKEEEEEEIEKFENPKEYDKSDILNCPLPKHFEEE